MTSATAPPPPLGGGGCTPLRRTPRAQPVDWLVCVPRIRSTVYFQLPRCVAVHRDEGDSGGVDGKLDKGTKSGMYERKYSTPCRQLARDDSSRFDLSATSDRKTHRCLRVGLAGDVLCLEERGRGRIEGHPALVRIHLPENVCHLSLMGRERAYW